jgi:hypothetical protein
MILNDPDDDLLQSLVRHGSINLDNIFYLITISDCLYVQFRAGQSLKSYLSLSQSVKYLSLYR